MTEVHAITSLVDLQQILTRPSEARPGCAVVDLDGGRDAVRAVLDALHLRLPLLPIGLVTSDENREDAMRLLRDRHVDRVIPKTHFEAGCGGHLEALAEQGAQLHALHERLKSVPTRTIFVTGATGFLGGHFLRYLLRCGTARVVALTRSTRETPFDSRLDHLQRLHPNRITCVQGDVGLPGLGLSNRDGERLSATIDEVWHLAALTKFEEILREEIVRVNLAGTRHVVDVARRFSRLTRFHHVSTAYVAGNWVGNVPVPEGPLSSPPEFKNPYEESKFHAEHVVAASGLPITIYRPSIILGEKVSGLCDGQTVYNVAKMLRLAQMAGLRAAARSEDAQPKRFRVVVDPGASKNLIPVDDVVCGMLHIAAAEPVPGSYFNLAHDVATPMTDLISVIASILDIQNYEAVQGLSDHPLSVSEAVLERVSGVFRPYMLKSDAHFETRDARLAGSRPAMLPLGQERLQALLRHFFEQHFDRAFQSVPAEV